MMACCDISCVLATQVKPRHNTGLPNETWCSDHIALLAEFAFRQT